MFSYIEGIFAGSGKNLAIIDVSGIGFSVSTSMYTLGRLESGSKVKLYTWLSVREDALELFGFSTEEELNVFRLLTSISGVGPKAALAILSTATPTNVALAIASGDEKLLTSAPGVGKKLASRIVLELKDKMLKNGASIAAQDLSMPADFNAAGDAEAALEALIVLGYSRAEAQKAVSGAPKGSSVEDIVRFALKNLVIPY